MTTPAPALPRRLARLTLAAALIVPVLAAAGAPAPVEPPKLHAAAEALRLAQRELAAAPSDRGGHRNKALQLVERALEQCERSAESLRAAH